MLSCYACFYAGGCEQLGNQDAQQSDDRSRSADGRYCEDACMDDAVPLPRPLAYPGAHQVTGMKMTFGRFKEIGERGFNLERTFNVKRGVTEAEDALPERLTNQPQDPEVPNSKVPLEALKEDYYNIRGWMKTGCQKKKLVKLGIEGVG